MTGPEERSLPATATAAIGGITRAASRALGSALLDLTSGIARIGEVARAVGSGQSIPPAVLRVRVVILRDETGTPLTSADAVRPALVVAERALLHGAGIRTRVLGVDVLDQPGTPATLDTRAHQALLWDDILGRTALFREVAAQSHTDVTGTEQRRRVSDDVVPIGVPVTVVVVRSVAGRITGCSLGINADWVVVEASLFDPSRPQSYDETVLAHELGHALNLPHLRDPGNLMHPESSPPGRIRGTALRRWQAAILQANRHVVPGPQSGPAPGTPVAAAASSPGGLD